MYRVDAIMRCLGALILGGACAGSGFAVGTYRERATLEPRIECAYHTGLDEGYNSAIAEKRIRNATPPVSRVRQTQSVTHYTDQQIRAIATDQSLARDEH